MKEFDREIKLIGEEAFNRLNSSRVLLFGVGGVGSYTFEALVRGGVGEIDIVDKDVVDITNINRQLVALQSTVGKDKVEVAKERALDINPSVKIGTYRMFYEPGDSTLDFTKYDYVIDCIDSVPSKIDIIERAKKCNVRVISSMGTGKKLDPTLFRISDISKTSVCPLARVVRKALKEKGIKDVKVLYSLEEPKKSENVISSISFVPSVAGLLIAGEVIKDIAGC
ncbi:MAG: tRNA threonylcarbamoyladenosine dehydratase [Clostridia bacterium]|nr:tRNA threonylcarbamoyladenosine dehydratase [Clostridia bacterium]